MKPFVRFPQHPAESTKNTAKARVLQKLDWVLPVLPTLLLVSALGWYVIGTLRPTVVFDTVKQREEFFASLGIDPRLRVITLVTSWCPACKGMESHLQDAKIPFLRLDIEQSAEGRRLYDRVTELTGERGIPQVIVDRVCVGHSFSAVKTALQSEAK